MAVFLCSSATPVISQPAALTLNPETACAALAGSGLGARGGYEKTPGGSYRCNSFRKTIITGNSVQDEIRFSALGSDTTVHELRLDLTKRSRGDTQRALRKLADYAAELVSKTLATDLPPAVTDAILSGVSGEWTADGHDYHLRRDTVADGLYALRLRIR